MNDYFYSRLYWGTHSKPRRAHLLRQHALQYPLSGYIPLSKKEDNSDE